MQINTIFQKTIKLSIFILSFSLIYTMFANSSGSQTGLSEETSGGCGCHGGTSNASTILSASTEGGFTFKPNEKKTITINVENSSKVAAGINASVKTRESGGIDAGTLTAGTGTQVRNNEITHSSTKNFSGDNTDFTFDWTAPNEAGEYYLLAVGNAVDGGGGPNADSFNWLEPVKITVQGINLTSMNSSEEYCASETIEVSWNSFGIEQVDIELSSNGGDTYDEVLASSVDGNLGAWEWSIPDSQEQTSTYKIRLTSSSDSEIYSESDDSFSISNLPLITSSPQDKETTTGSNFILSVTAEGDNLTYVWFKDGNQIAGDAGPDLNFINIGLDDAGEYYCEVTNDCGTVKSDIAVITVEEAGEGPILTVSEDSIDFGNITVGDEEKVLFEDFFVNTGDRALIINSVELSDQLGGIFELNEFFATTIQPGRTRDILLTFRPDAAGEFNTTLLVVTDHGDNRTINIKGFGVNPVAEVTSDIPSVDFGEVEVGMESNQIVTLTNNSNLASATINNIQLENSNQNYRLATPDDFSDAVILDPLETYSFDIIFKPIETGSADFSDVVIVDFESASDINIDIEGIGIEPKSVKQAILESKSYPIPTNQSINFELKLVESGEYNFRIINSLGELVKSFEPRMISSNDISLIWDGRNSFGLEAPSGTYFLLVDGKSSKSEIKFIINR